MGYLGQRVIRQCYDCKIKFDAPLMSNNRGAYVVCPHCGKKIAVKSTHKNINWEIGSIKRTHR